MNERPETERVGSNKTGNELKKLRQRHNYVMIRLEEIGAERQKLLVERNQLREKLKASQPKPATR